MGNAMQVLARVCVAAAIAAATFGCDSDKAGGGKGREGKAAAKTARKYPLEKVWTADEIAADPEGYMVWAGGRVDDQVHERTKRLHAVQNHLQKIRDRQEALKTRLGQLRNVQMRMEQAVRRAEDEDRWPASMGGKQFSRDEAQDIIRQARQYVQDNQPLVGAYDKAVARAESAAQSLQRDLNRLAQYRERLDLDLGNIRLAQGMDQVKLLREKEQDIARFTKTLGTMADDSLGESLPDEKQPTDVLKGFVQ